MLPVSTTSTVPESGSRIDRWFEISQRGSTRGREIRGGLVTFFTMAYILALNPLIIGTAADKNGKLLNGAPKFLDAAGKTLNEAAIDQNKMMVLAATALIAGIMTILMGVWGRFPLGIAAGLGINSLLAYSVAPTMTWPQAMGLVVWEGVLIFIFVITGVREAIFRSVPRSLRAAISVGIGMFVAFVGLVDSGVIRAGSGTPVQLGIAGSLEGWPIAMCVIGFLLVVILQIRKVPGSMLITIVTVSVLSVIVESIAKLGPRVGDDNPTGWAQNVPKLPSASSFSWPDLSLVGKVDLVGGFLKDGHFNIATFVGVLLVVFSLMLADFFDTVGTVVAIGNQAGLNDAQGNPPHLKEILMVDSLSAVAGGLGSASSATGFVESSAGVGEGARTGLASVTTGLAFLVAMFVSPVITMIPSEAAAPMLVFVGFLMMAQVRDIDWTDIAEGVPAFLTVIFMPFAYSITVGIGAGFIVYCITKLVTGKARLVHPLLWVVSALFVVYFAQGLLLGLL
jgi:AGZA family xanthine/uracil permease-like MFS transporter